MSMPDAEREFLLDRIEDLEDEVSVLRAQLNPNDKVDFDKLMTELRSDDD